MRCAHREAAYRSHRYVGELEPELIEQDRRDEREHGEGKLEPPVRARLDAGRRLLRVGRLHRALRATAAPLRREAVRTSTACDTLRPLSWCVVVIMVRHAARHARRSRWYSQRRQRDADGASDDERTMYGHAWRWLFVIHNVQEGNERSASSPNQKVEHDKDKEDKQSEVNHVPAASVLVQRLESPHAAPQGLLYV